MIFNEFGNPPIDSNLDLLMNQIRLNIKDYLKLTSCSPLEMRAIESCLVAEITATMGEHRLMQQRDMRNARKR